MCNNHAESQLKKYDIKFENLTVLAPLYLYEQPQTRAAEPEPPTCSQPVCDKGLSNIPHCKHICTVLTAQQKEQAKLKRKEAMDNIVHALQLYKPNELLFCFDGGKECTVLLDLLLEIYKKLCITFFPMPTIYVKTDDDLPEVKKFVEMVEKKHKLNLFMHKGSMKGAWEAMKVINPKLRAVFMGSRATAPKSTKAELLQKPLDGWPKLMRLHPLLNWTYHDVWNHLRHFNLEFCKLYEDGYTSLGHKSDTLPNPHLLCYCPEARRHVHQPAYTLKDPAHEYAGRVRIEREAEPCCPFYTM